jgi:penicillin G amidase
MLARWFDLTTPVGGDGNTVDVAGYTISNEVEPFVNHHGASLRQVIDFENLEQSIFVQSTGQSGNRLSPYYSNLFERWRNVEFVPMRMQREAIERAPNHTLRITP